MLQRAVLEFSVKVQIDNHPPRKSPEKWTFLSLVFCNAPSCRLLTELSCCTLISAQTSKLALTLSLSHDGRLCSFSKPCCRRSALLPVLFQRFLQRSKPARVSVMCPEEALQNLDAQVATTNSNGNKIVRFQVAERQQNRKEITFKSLRVRV